MRFGLDLLHAHYNLVSNPGQRHIFTLKEHVFRLEGRAEHRSIMVDNWLLQLSLALCLRDADAVELICRCEEDWLEYPDAFDFALLKFMRNIFVQDADQTVLLREVMEKSGPEHVDEFRAPYVNQLFLPYLDVWVAVLSNDAAHYQQAIHKAIELHYTFYNDPPEGAVTWTGDVALLISAVASLAYDKHGWQVPDTPYLPKWLIYKEFENA
ncbi:immunity 49 family protein [Pseudoalteromonas sp. SG43-5]|uniref:immunity 49 family protein n=1 Tax=Pseudoalteromonas sp. SG43-5 TaxID=2760968 RepID=UPI0016044C10|nr:immunity 49 family protein [Pseudoalteromonas sp. SG43-5]MBB1454340.1 immunity 49 family protein [Pseudoalteromonas sp. SG43-5]